MNNDTSFDIIQESNPVQTVAQPKEDNEMLRATDRITALYCRLSVEDTKEDKKNSKEDLSNSIQNQKSILLQYARDHRFPHPTFFIDDGYSGVDFANRPGFQKMLAEIEAGNVGTVITKDLSRLGRNSSLTGLYINYTFPQNDVRYIAINDHFDSINPNSTDSDIAGIKNWFNEFFAKDTSRKIRAVQKAKGERGERLTVHVPYGYRKDPEDKTKWIIDEEAAQVVKKIFTLCMNGRGPSQIAEQLEREKILTPTAYKTKQGVKTPHTEPENPIAGTKAPSSIFLNAKSILVLLSTSKPIPIPFGIRSRGRIPKKIKRFSTILILRLSNRKSLTRCRKSDSSDTGERQRARAVRFRAWCSALIADRSSTTPPPTTLKSGRTFSSAPRTEPTRTSAAGITSEPSFWRMWSGNT